VRRDKAALFQWVQGPPGDRSSRITSRGGWFCDRGHQSTNRVARRSRTLALIGIGSSSAVGLISARRLTHRRPGRVRQTRLSFLRPAQGAAGLARALIDFDVWHLGLRSIFDATPAHQANLGAKRIPRTAQNTCERAHTSGFSFVGDVALDNPLPRKGMPACAFTVRMCSKSR
jgi:hypothetical protein